jgi:hypothetical protein
MFICISFSLSLCMALSPCLCMYIFLSLCLSVCVCMYVCLSLPLSLSIYVCMSFSPSPSVSMYVCISFSLSLSLIYITAETPYNGHPLQQLCTKARCYNFLLLLVIFLYLHDRGWVRTLDDWIMSRVFYHCATNNVILLNGLSMWLWFKKYSLSYIPRCWWCYCYGGQYMGFPGILFHHIFIFLTGTLSTAQNTA